MFAWFDYRMIPHSSSTRMTRTERMVHWLAGVVDRFNDRCNRIGEQRRGRSRELTMALAIAFFFHAMFGAYFFIEVFQIHFDPPRMAFVPLFKIILTIIAGVSFGLIPIYNFGTLLTRIGSLSGDAHKEWVVGLMVDGFFELLGNIQSTKANHTELVAGLYEFGFIIIGMVLSQIHLHFVTDNTGITNGAILSVTKVLFGFSLVTYDSTTSMEWLFGVTLLFSCFFFKFNEGALETNVQAIELQPVEEAAPRGQGADAQTTGVSPPAAAAAAPRGQGADAQTTQTTGVSPPAAAAAAPRGQGADAQTTGVSPPAAAAAGERTDAKSTTEGEKEETSEKANEEEINRKGKQTEVPTTKPNPESEGNRGLKGITING